MINYYINLLFSTNWYLFCLYYPKVLKDCGQKCNEEILPTWQRIQRES
jgi:hypothetical protein